MTKRRKTRSVDKNQYNAFLAKAKDFASMMDISFEEGKWNSAGLQAVHTVISASDAVIVYYGGVRSAEIDHREVVGLLHDIIGSRASEVGRHVSRVIAKKNLVEYEERLIIQSEARDMIGHAKSFLKWVIGMLPDGTGDRGSGIGDRGSGIGDRGSGIGDRGSGIGLEAEKLRS